MREFCGLCAPGRLFCGSCFRSAVLKSNVIHHCLLVTTRSGSMGYHTFLGCYSRMDVCRGFFLLFFSFRSPESAMLYPPHPPFSRLFARVPVRVIRTPLPHPQRVTSYRYSTNPERFKFDGSVTSPPTPGPQKQSFFSLLLCRRSPKLITHHHANLLVGGSGCDLGTGPLNRRKTP